jgi:hypothetical protein
MTIGTWYARMIWAGHIVVPIPLLICALRLSDYLSSGLDKELLLRRPADWYYARHPTNINSEEFMGTYIRFAATPEEEYGLKKANRLYHDLYVNAIYYKLIMEKLMAKLKPVFFFSLYSGYLHHQIPCEIAHNLKVPILVFGCSDCLYRISDTLVPRQFLSVSCKDLQERLPGKSTSILIDKGLRSLKKRVSGFIDPNISYMKTSPYSEYTPGEFEDTLASLNMSNVVPYKTIHPKWKARSFIVLYMHEFYDWHHNGVLPSFASSYYDWLLQSCLFLSENDIQFVVKLHPAIVRKPIQYKESIASFGRISDYISSALVYSARETTLDLIQGGMRLGVTVRGTIVTELAYLRIPFICAGNPPYGHLFRSRIVDDKREYVERLQHFFHEPPITDLEINMAGYYVGFLEEAASVPHKHNCSNVSVRLSPDRDYSVYKAKM